MDLVCAECGRTATRLRRERCNACYMRLYRHGEIPDDARCAGCGERRHEVLVFARVGGRKVILCGNCQVILSRRRPEARRLEDLRGAPTPEPAPYIPPPPSFDPSID